MDIDPPLEPGRREHPVNKPGRLWALASAGAGLALLVVVAFFWSMHERSAVRDVGSSDSTEALLETTGTDRIATATAGRAVFSPGSLWRTADEGTAQRLPPFAADWSEEGRVLVDVSPATAAAPNWRVGDAVAIVVPQLGERYETTIERIDEGPGGSRAARGLMLGEDGHSWRFVVTVGPMHVFAYVDTPRGSYELAGDNRLGWLLPTSSMLAGWDFSEPDYLLPERRDGGNDRR